MSGTRFGFVLALGVGVVPVFGAATVVDVPSGAVLTEADLLAGVFMGQEFDLDWRTEFVIKSGGRLAPLGVVDAGDPLLFEPFDMGDARVRVEPGGILGDFFADADSPSAIADVELHIDGAFVEDRLIVIGASSLELSPGSELFVGPYIDHDTQLWSDGAIVGSGFALAGESSAALIRSDVEDVRVGPLARLEMFEHSTVHAAQIEGLARLDETLNYSGDSAYVPTISWPVVLGEGVIDVYHGSLPNGVELHDRGSFRDLSRLRHTVEIGGIRLYDDASVSLSSSVDGPMVARGNSWRTASVWLSARDKHMQFGLADLENVSFVAVDTLPASDGPFDRILIEDLRIAGDSTAYMANASVGSLWLSGGGPDDDFFPLAVFDQVRIGASWWSLVRAKGVHFTANDCTFFAPFFVFGSDGLPTSVSLVRSTLHKDLTVEGGATVKLRRTEILGALVAEAGATIELQVRYALLDGVMLPQTGVIPQEINERDGLLTLVWHDSTFQNVVLDGGSAGHSFDPSAKLMLNTKFGDFCSADVDLDGAVGAADLARVVASFGAVVQDGPLGGDVDYSGSVNALDITTVLGQFGDDCR